MATPKKPNSSSATLTASAAVFRSKRKANPQTDRQSIAQPWQVEAYRHTNICGEARYAATLFAAIAARAEIGISEPQALGRKAVWTKIEDTADEHGVLGEIAPTVRDRTRLIRDYMLHRVIAGECYLIARDRVDTDVNPTSKTPIWEIVAVTELQRLGDTWTVRHDNGNYISLSATDPVIRMWNPDPADRREAWSPFRSLLPTLKEIEWLTAHIFTQVRSRLVSSGVWFLPDNLTFPPPPVDAVEGGAEAIATMNEAERFMMSLAASATQGLEGDEVAFPSVVMASPEALAAVDQAKLIKFWADIDDKAMVLRSDAVRRFALGMDLPPEQILGSSGVAVSGSAGSAGSTNHWGIWANEEQTISAHVEPALDDFTGVLTDAVLREAVPQTDKVIAYDTATLRLRQDRSKEAIEWYDRGIMKAEVALRENGFDPENDMMDAEERKEWLLGKIASGSASPEQVQAALILLGVNLPVQPPREFPSGADKPAPKAPDRKSSLEKHPYEGPPREDHDHKPAAYAAIVAASEGLVLRALEKAGNRLLNSGKRGRDKDRSTPAHLAHLTAALPAGGEGDEQLSFDFTLLSTVFGDLSAQKQAVLTSALTDYCSDLYRRREAYSRESLATALLEFS